MSEVIEVTDETDSVEGEERLKQMVECLKKEISDDILERIVNAQKKYNHKDVYGDADQNLESPWCYGGDFFGMKNVATMTEQAPVSAASTRGTDSGSGATPTEADKKASKRRAAEDKKQVQLANKMFKPGECMKHMTVELHPALSASWVAADVPRELAAAGARVRASAAVCSPAVVLWSRALPSALVPCEGQVQLAAKQRGCSRALYVATAEELSELVAAKRLSQEMDTMAQLTSCQVTLVVFGAEDYFRPSGRKRANNHRQQMTEVEFEMAITDALVTAGCDTVRVETPNELALTILHYTKAIAEAPHKLEKRQNEERAQFYMRGDNKNCVTVAKDGAGLRQLWQQMLAVLPMSSLERARALCARYPAPRHLVQEVQRAGGVETIADVGVPRSAVPGSVARRTGVEFARKLAVLFGADDGDTLVQ